VGKKNQQPSHQGHGYVELRIRGRRKKKSTGEGFGSKLGWAKKAWLSAGSGWASFLLIPFFYLFFFFLQNYFREKQEISGKSSKHVLTNKV
jgi:hypothetical protein